MNKKCSSCREIKELTTEFFPRRKSSKDGFDSQCKACRKEYDRKRYIENSKKFRKVKTEYYHANKEARKQYQKEYYQKNAKKCKSLNSKWQKENPVVRRIINARSRSILNGSKSTLTESEWLKIKELFNNSCAYCGMSEEQSIKTFGEKLHHEHVVPIADGGTYSFGNIVPSCRSCNSSKANKEFNIWYSISDGYCTLREKRILDYLARKE